MEALVATAIGALTASGVFLMLRRTSFAVIVGAAMLSYAVNVFLFAIGGLATNMPPVLGASEAGLIDPLPQALVLTAIVIGFATTALYLVVMIGSRGLTGTDHVDGKEPDL